MMCSVLYAAWELSVSTLAGTGGYAERDDWMLLSFWSDEL
jgi:hypothetical protein